MMTAIVQEEPQAAVLKGVIPPHMLIVGKKNAVDYIAPALFRLGSFGQLVVRAKGSFSIVTAVNVAEMVKHDVTGLQSRSIKIGTEEMIIEGMTRRVSFIEIHLAVPAPKVIEPAVIIAPPTTTAVEVPVIEVVREAVEVVVEAPVIEAPVVEQVPAVKMPIVEEAATAAVVAAPAEKLAQAAAKSKKIRAKAKAKSAKTTKKKAPARKTKKAE